ncbi:MAG: hypothetical protein Kow0031_18360 [Anaerolineae bacterium]
MPKISPSISSLCRLIGGVLLAAGAAAALVWPVAASSGITVTSATDTTATDNACTLREAIANANGDTDTTGGDCAAGNGADVITFSPALRGQTITLTGGELLISGVLTISGPGADLLAVSGGGASRVLKITGGAVNIRGLAIRDGRISGANGGGIYNSGALTLDHVAVVSNTIVTGSTTDGGGIYNSGTLTISHSAIISNANLGSNGRGGGLANSNGAAQLINSTVSGNRATVSGGGIYNANPAVFTSTQSTIAANVAVGVQGGGIYVEDFSSSTTFLKNTILADNVANGSGQDCYKLNAAPTSQGNNLVEKRNNCTFSAAGDITGQDPKLGPLADNGGPTPSHALLNGSPANERIPLGTAGCGTTFTTDQRDFLRVNACSLGATEYNGVWLSLRKSVDDDTPEPGQSITYTVVAALAPSGNVSVTNLLINDALPAGVNFVGPLAVTGGSGGSNGPFPTLVSGQTLSGGHAVTVTFPVTVSTGQQAGTLLTNTAQSHSSEWTTPVVASQRLTVSNAAPVAVDNTLTVREDSGITSTRVMSNDFDLNGDVINLSTVGSGDKGGANGIGGRVITYSPALNFNGTEVFTYAISDGDLTGEAVVTATVQAVNDAPSFTAGADQWLLQTDGPQSVPGWATAISPGPADEAGQSLTFTVRADRPQLFTVQPSLSGGGQLGFAPVATQSGASVVTVTLQDSGGTALGGADTSSPQTFTVSIVPGDEMSEIDPATGGSLAYSASGLSSQVQVPGGAVTGAIRLVYDEFSASSHRRPTGYAFAGRTFTLEAYQSGQQQAGYQFIKPITLTLTYNPDPAALNYADESSLALRHWNGSSWDSSGITPLNHDLVNHRLTFRLSHLSEYALVGYAPVLGLAQQVGTPRPKPFPGSMVTYTLTFSNDGSLPANGLVVSQTLPAGVGFEAWLAQSGASFNPAGNILTWGSQTLPAYTPVTVRFTARVSASSALSNTVLTSTARFNSTNAGSAKAEAAFTTSFYYVRYFPIIFKKSAP